MNDYKERFDKWQRDAREKFEEIDKQLGLKEKLGESARAVVETAQKGAEKIKSEAEKSDLGKKAVKVAGVSFKTAEETAKKAWDASEPIREVAGEAAGMAGEAVKETAKKADSIIDDARASVQTNARRVSKAFSLGAGWTRTLDSAVKSISSASAWVQEYPLQAAATGASMAVGAGLGVVFTGISSHWLFNSALPAWSVKKIAEQFNDYLKIREKLIANGELEGAEAERVKFERDIAKRIGAPLLGAFSFASGAVMMTNILNPKTVTGAPIDWILGGNPMLEGVWFFGNGLVCFKTSYDFFMIALDGQKDIERMVREIKGLLPQSVSE
ncbi:MAG: hypothetical protein LC730_01450 [Acidobacteria bacterium]|nr:hypothetical protein [Acidobacteriota bacterium]MCA1608111.1 hypothetical protein [Acidobacteriota bacterium]